MRHAPTFGVAGQPGETIYWCPVCGAEIYRSPPLDSYDLRVRSEIEKLDNVSQEVEWDANQHMAEKHRIRFWLWERLRWTWLLNG